MTRQTATADFDFAQVQQRASKQVLLLGARDAKALLHEEESECNLDI